jgi:hypothetical protein
MSFAVVGREGHNDEVTVIRITHPKGSYIVRLASADIASKTALELKGLIQEAVIVQRDAEAVGPLPNLSGTIDV